MWNNPSKKLPKIGDRVLVMDFLGQVLYAVYTDNDEFDAHRPNGKVESRDAWRKYSSLTIVKWRYFTKSENSPIR